MQFLRTEKDIQETKNLALQEEHRHNDQELKRLNRVCQNKELALVELQKTLDEVEVSLLAAHEKAQQSLITGEKVAALEAQQSLWTQEAALFFVEDSRTGRPAE